MQPKEDNSRVDCNCNNKESCPLNGRCREKSVIYECMVTTTNENNEAKSYIGATEGEIKQRIRNHYTSFNDVTYKNCSELSKYVWSLKEHSKPYELKWKIIDNSHPYRNGSKRCQLCITEKAHIIKAEGNQLINKRSELISKCRHENKFYLRNYKGPRKKTQHCRARNCVAS